MTLGIFPTLGDRWVWVTSGTSLNYPMNVQQSRVLSSEGYEWDCVSLL